MTLGQLAAVFWAYNAPDPKLIEILVTHGSPVRMIRGIFGDNVDFTQHVFFPMMMLFHLFKYLFLARSQFIEERHSLHYLAVIFEVIYLGICIYELP